MKIDPQLSERAIRAKICQPLGLGLEEAAEGMLRVINAVMTKAIRKLSVERGYDPRDFTLIAFGGGGPLHAIDLAIDLQIPRVLVPPAPGVSSALGLLTADFRHDYVRTLLWTTSEHTLSDLEEQLSFLKGQVLSQMASEGIAADTVTCLPHLDMRYQGQGYSLDIHFTLDEAISWDSLRPLERRFHEKHQSVYGYGDAHHPVEIVNVRLAGVGKLSRPKFPLLPAGPADPAAALKGHRKVFLRGSWQNVAIYDRSLFKAGSLIPGPAIIEQVDSTTFLYAEQHAEVDTLGNIMIRV
jgi:N-methylhydantoinase A